VSALNLKGNRAAIQISVLHFRSDRLCDDERESASSDKGRERTLTKGTKGIGIKNMPTEREGNLTMSVRREE
jgi:hypothetical protein